MGGGLLQKLNRDTQKFAFKCSNIVVNGVNQDVYKSPIGAPWKGSKRGRLKLINVADALDPPEFKTVSDKDTGFDWLVEVFRDGTILKQYTLAEVRERAKV